LSSLSITNKNYTIHDANRSASEKRAARTLKRKFNSPSTTKVLTETLYNQLDSIETDQSLIITGLFNLWLLNIIEL
jgi:hypothetical protein